MTAPRALSVATHLAPSVLPAYALAARRIGERLGRGVELVVAADYDRCAADIDDVCFVCSIPYLLLADAGRIGMTPIAAPVLRGRRYADRPVYFSEVVVRSGAPYRSFADLTGTRWAFNEPFSHSGFVVALHALVTRGHGADFLGQWVEAGFHDDAIHVVLDGAADWAAVDTQVLDLWRRWHPALRRELRTVAILGPSTIQPVVASTTRLGADERLEAATALLEIDRDPMARRVLAACGVRRFVAIDAAAYRDVRDMLAAVESAGLLPTWWRDRWERIAGDAPAVSRRSPERAHARGARSTAPPDAPARPRRSSPRPSPSPS